MRPRSSFVTAPRADLHDQQRDQRDREGRRGLERPAGEARAEGGDREHEERPAERRIDAVRERRGEVAEAMCGGWKRAS